LGDRTCRTAFSIAGASLILMPLALPAAAGVPTTRCAKFVTPAPIAVDGVRTRIATVKGCAGLPPGASGRSVTNLRTHVNVTTWSDGLGTTTAEVTYGGGPRANHCPKGTNLILVRGKVTGGTGAERELFRIGEPMSARLCMNDHAAATLEPGSSYRFGARASTTTTTTGTTRTTSAPPRTTSPPTTPTTHKTTTTTTPPTTTTTPAPGGSNPPPPVSVPAGLSACPAGANSAMVTLVNRDRQQTGNLPALRENVNLDWAARKHSIVMATTSVMSHNGWDTEIHDSNYVVGAPGWTGQNIAWMTGSFAPSTIESGFFNEVPPNDGHRLNILSTNYHNIGIGCMVNNSTGAYWWAQDFGS
jgi:uncharacterized protein YkwD